MNSKRALLLAVTWVCLWACPGAFAEAPERPSKALRLMARPVAEKVELGGPVEAELTFTNMGQAPFSIHVPSAAGCKMKFWCWWGRGDGGNARWPKGRPAPAEPWQRLAPGQSLRVPTSLAGISCKATGPLIITLTFCGQWEAGAPDDRFWGDAVCEPFTIRVVDNALLRALNAARPDAETVRAELSRLVEKAAADSPDHVGDLFDELRRTHGPLLVAPLAELAADKSVAPETRARAARCLGDAVYYAPREQQPPLRQIALPALQGLLGDPSAAVRAAAVRALGTADRTTPHLEGFDALLADPEEKVRAAAADTLTGFKDHRETWPYVKKALADPSGRVRWHIVKAGGLEWPRTRADAELLLECVGVANEKDALDLLGYLGRCVSAADVARLARIYDAKPPAIQAEIVRVAGLAVSADLAALLEKAVASEDAAVRAAALDVIEQTGEPADLLRSVAAAGAPEDRKRARAVLERLSAPVPLPDIRRMMAEVLPPKPPAPPADRSGPGAQPAGAAAGDGAAPKHKTTYCGCSLTIERRGRPKRENAVALLMTLTNAGEAAPLTIPVADEGIEGHFQYVLYKDGTEVERGNAGLENHSRYYVIPFGSIGRISGGGQRGLQLKPALPPGTYDVQIEARFLCTEQVRHEGGRWGAGPRTTAAEVFTLRSNRLALALAPPSAEADEQAATSPPDAADDDLADFDPKTATEHQILMLARRRDPQALAALEAAFLAGRPSLFLPELIPCLGRSRRPEVIDRLVEIATADLATERGPPGFHWWMASREALSALDGHLGPAHKTHVPALVEELAGRLIERRDRYAGRGGEAIWGAFRTAFFLGRIGDPRANSVLRRAARSENLMPRWYAAAALKLIDVQGRPEHERKAVAAKWLRHCFASPEEHFMARARLIPYLNGLLGDDAQAVYTDLARRVEDPWMRCDVLQVLRAAGG